MRKAALALAVAACVQACSSPPPRPAPRPSLLDRYTFGNARRIALPDELREVSGLATTPDGRLFAHDDEQGVIRQVDPATGALAALQIALAGRAARGDYEGLAWVRGRFLLVRSDGLLASVAADGGGQQVEDTGLGRRCELEGLAWDAKRDRLLLACKEPHGRWLDGGLALLPWSLAARAAGEPLVARRGRTRDFGYAALNASGVEVDPLSGNYVVVAARQQAIAEMTPDGELIAVRPLPREHLQPEGIAFLPDGTLLIADEGRPWPGLLTAYSPR